MSEVRGARQQLPDALAGLDRFLSGVVEPLERDHALLLADPRRRYGSSGVLSPAVLDIKRQVRQAASAAGLYGLTVPADLGGPGLSWLDQYAVWRHLYGRAGPDRILPYDTIGTFTSGPGASLGGLSERARAEVWPRILSGEVVLCFALTEPEGSGQRQTGTIASRTAGGFVLRGRKAWVSRGGYADYALAYARLQPTALDPTATSAFLVPLSAPGVKIVSVELLLGRVGGEEVTLDFADVALGTWQLVGEPDRGAVVAASGALAGTMFTAGRFVGLAAWALQHAAAAQAAGGFENSDVRQLLAEANADLEATDLLARECAARAAAGGEHQRLQTAVRVTAPEMCGRVYERAMTVEGSEALTNRARLFDGWHQSRIVQVAQSGLRRTWHDATARDLTESTPEK